MRWWTALLIRVVAPLLADALTALLRSLSEAGARPASTLRVAVDIVAGLERSAVPPAERRERAAEAVRLYLAHATGQAPPVSTVNAIVELALQQVRHAPA